MNPDSTLRSIRKYCEGSKRTLHNCRLFLNFVNGVDTKMADVSYNNSIQFYNNNIKNNFIHKLFFYRKQC